MIHRKAVSWCDQLINIHEAAQSGVVRCWPGLLMPSMVPIFGRVICCEHWEDVDQLCIALINFTDLKSQLLQRHLSTDVANY